MCIKGNFQSVWDNGSVTTRATLNIKTGELSTEIIDAGELGSLIEECFTSDNGDEYQVCMECHEYILKGKMFNDQVGDGLHEKMICANPHCDSHQQ